MPPAASSFRTAIDAAPLSRRQIAIVALAVLSLISDGYDTQAMGNVAPVLLKAGMIERAFMGYVFSAGTLGLTIGTIFFASIADRIGTKRVILACTAAYAGLTFALVFADTPAAFLILRFLAGLGLGGVMPSAIALVSDYVPSRLRVMLVALVVAGFALGGSLGGFLAAILIPHYGWQAVFLAGALFPLLILLPVAVIWMPESLPYLLRHADVGRLLAVTRRIVPAWRPQPEDMGPGPDRHKASVTTLFAEGYARPTWLFWLAYFANLLLLYLLAVWLPTMMSFSGLSIEAANVTTGLYQFSGLFGGLALGWIADRGKPQLVLALSFVVSAMALCLISISHGSTLALAASVFLAGFCVIGGQGALNGFVSTFYPSAVRATGQGWAIGIGRTGSVLGPSLGGWLMAANVLPPTVFRLCIVASIVAAVAVWFIRRPFSYAGSKPLDAVATKQSA